MSIACSIIFLPPGICVWGEFWGGHCTSHTTPVRENGFLRTGNNRRQKLYWCRSLIPFPGKSNGSNEGHDREN